MTQTYITYADLKPGDTITFQTIDNGFGGSGQFIDRTGVVKSVGPKAAIVLSPEGQPGPWRAMIRAAKWYDRQVRRVDNTQDPKAIDTQLAEIHRRQTDASDALDTAIDQAHHAIGDRKVPRWGWGKGHDETETTIRDMATTYEQKPWDRYNPTAIVAAIDTARAEIEKCRTEARPLNDLYNAAPWARFFLVTSSDGHIHSSMGCQTCRPTTSFTWLPDLSGTTEADAVAAHGPRLCTVCFPSAPIEWTIGVQKPKTPKTAHCDGTPDPQSPARRTGMNLYRRCTCGSVQIVTASGALRKHRPGA